MRALKGETVENKEVWIKDKEAGIEKYLLVSSRPVKDSTGQITAAIADFRDNRNGNLESSSRPSWVRGLIGLRQSEAKEYV